MNEKAEWNYYNVNKNRKFSVKIFVKTYIGMLTPGATELLGGGRIPP